MLLIRYILCCVHSKWWMHFSSSVIWLVCQRVTIIISPLNLSFITVLTLYFSLFTGEYHTLLCPMMVLQPIREYGLAVWCGNFSDITLMRVALSNCCRLCCWNLSSTAHKNVLRCPSSLIVLSFHPSISVYLRMTFQRSQSSVVSTVTSYRLDGP
jgi:hypothetical protein